MSEKVLGFKEKDVKIINVCDDAEIVSEPIFRWEVEGSEKDKLVSVRLASESVDLEKLKGECKRLFDEVPKKERSYAAAGYILAIRNILIWAEKEAKKNE